MIQNRFVVILVTFCLLTLIACTDDSDPIMSEEIDPTVCNVIFSDCNKNCLDGDIEEWNGDLCRCIVTMDIVKGCLAVAAINYNPIANCDDGSCEFPCEDPGTCTTDCDDGILEVWDGELCECKMLDSVIGCTNSSAFNYEESANCDDATCLCDQDAFIDVYMGSIDCPWVFQGLNTFQQKIEISQFASSTQLQFLEGPLENITIESNIFNCNIFLEESTESDSLDNESEVIISGDLMLINAVIEGFIELKTVNQNNEVLVQEECFVQFRKF